jgi:hypothetical protein
LLAQAGNKHITDWNAEEKTKNPHATYVWRFTTDMFWYFPV